MRLRRVPIESAQPVVVFAIGRLVLALASLVAVAVLGFPFHGRAAATLGAVAVPWSIMCLLLARARPRTALGPLVAIGDLLVLLVLELVVPEAYGATRFAALFMIAAHAHFQGEQRGPAAAAVGAAALVLATWLRGHTKVEGDLLAYYEVVFMLSALAIGVVVGMLRTTESTGRLRARGVSRRSIQAEGEVRRRVAEAIHDGPVQELIGLDMVLSSARKAASEQRGADAASLIDEARELAERNIRMLRDEIVDLGPYAFEELTFDVAIDNCMPAWMRRYDFQVLASIERVELPPEVAGGLFRIAQEAVVNAGRHSGAEAVSITMRALDSHLELRVTDNGRGFEGWDPLRAGDPDHLGLASMRERAELLDGTLDIETSDRGTRVVVRAPVPKGSKR